MHGLAAGRRLKWLQRRLQRLKVSPLDGHQLMFSGDALGVGASASRSCGGRMQRFWSATSSSATLPSCRRTSGCTLPLCCSRHSWLRWRQCGSAWSGRICSS